MLVIEQGHLQDTCQREREIVHPVGHRALVERLGQAFGVGQGVEQTLAARSEPGRLRRERQLRAA